MKFKNIYKETKENVELALLSLWAPGKHRMRVALKDLFKREPLMAEPVFQSDPGGAADHPDHAVPGHSGRHPQPVAP